MEPKQVTIHFINIVFAETLMTFFIVLLNFSYYNKALHPSIVRRIKPINLIDDFCNCCDSSGNVYILLVNTQIAFTKVKKATPQVFLI